MSMDSSLMDSSLMDSLSADIQSVDGGGLFSGSSYKQIREFYSKYKTSNETAPHISKVQVEIMNKRVRELLDHVNLLIKSNPEYNPIFTKDRDKFDELFYQFIKLSKMSDEPKINATGSPIEEVGILEKIFTEPTKYQKYLEETGKMPKKYEIKDSWDEKLDNNKFLENYPVFKSIVGKLMDVIFEKQFDYVPEKYEEFEELFLKLNPKFGKFFDDGYRTYLSAQYKGDQQIKFQDNYDKKRESIREILRNRHAKHMKKYPSPRQMPLFRTFLALTDYIYGSLEFYKDVRPESIVKQQETLYKLGIGKVGNIKDFQKSLNTELTLEPEKWKQIAFSQGSAIIPLIKQELTKILENGNIWLDEVDEQSDQLVSALKSIKRSFDFILGSLAGLKARDQNPDKTVSILRKVTSDDVSLLIKRIGGGIGANIIWLVILIVIMIVLIYYIYTNVNANVNANTNPSQLTTDNNVPPKFTLYQKI